MGPKRTPNTRKRKLAQSSTAVISSNQGQCRLHEDSPVTRLSAGKKKLTKTKRNTEESRPKKTLIQCKNIPAEIEKSATESHAIPSSSDDIFKRILQSKNCSKRQDHGPYVLKPLSERSNNLTHYVFQTATGARCSLRLKQVTIFGIYRCAIQTKLQTATRYSAILLLLMA